MAKERDDTIASRISRVLADRIIRGELAPDARLRQDHIAEEFGTSHVPVREAFRRLEAQGLAINLPRRGVRVASFDLKEVREVAEMRAALEGLALRHAAQHLTQAILDAAEEATREGDAASDVYAWEEANRRFHRLILAGSITGSAFITQDGTAIPLPQNLPRSTGELLLGIRPEALDLCDPADPSAVTAKLVSVEPTGAESHVSLTLGGEEIVAVIRERLADKPGTALSLKLSAAGAHLFDKATGARVPDNIQ